MEITFNKIILDYVDELESKGIEKHACVDLRDIDKLADHDFAILLIDSRGNKKRLYPINSRNSTIMSVGAFTKHAFKLPENPRHIARQRLEEACYQYNMMSEPVGHKPSSPNFVVDMRDDANAEEWLLNQIKIAEHIADTRKTSMSAADFAYVKDLRDRSEWYYCVADKKNTIASACSFEKDAHRIYPGDRVKVASRLLQKLTEFGDDARKYVKIAGYSADNTNTYVVRSAIRSRKELTLSKDAHQVLDVLMSKHAEYKPIEFADKLLKFDEAMGFGKYWDRQLNDPYKILVPMDEIVKTAGSGFNERLIKLADFPDILKQYIDDDLVNQFVGDPIVEFNH